LIYQKKAGPGLLSIVIRERGDPTKPRLVGKQRGTLFPVHAGVHRSRAPIAITMLNLRPWMQLSMA